MICCVKFSSLAIFCVLSLSPALFLSLSLPLSPSLSSSLPPSLSFPLSLTSCEYKNTCTVLVSLFDQTASSYQELLQQPSPPPQQLLLREGIHTHTSVPFAIEILASESWYQYWRWMNIQITCVALKVVLFPGPSSILGAINVYSISTYVIFFQVSFAGWCIWLARWLVGGSPTLALMTMTPWTDSSSAGTAANYL